MRKFASVFLGASLFAVGLAGCGTNGNNVDTYNDGDVRILDQQNQDRENDRGLNHRNTNDYHNRNNNDRSNIMNNGNRRNNGNQNCDGPNAGKNGTYNGEGSIGDRNVNCGNGTNAGPSGQGGLG